MVFSATLFTSVLLATSALAAPSLEGRLARRRAQRQSQTLQRVEGTVSNVQYSSNWAGAVYDTEPSGTFTAVTGTFTVPTPSGSGAASAWVGIDGDTCGNAILQTGVDFTVSGGSVSYDAWYEWYPDYAYDFTNFAISAGDVIKTTVTATSTTSGEAVIENLTTGQTVSKQITSSYALCEANAEWIVEDFEENGALVPFADFGAVTFSNAYATTTSGSSLTPSGADTIDIEQNNKVLTSVTTSGESVTIKYV